MAMVDSRVAHIPCQASEGECDVRSRHGHSIHEASDDLLVLRCVDSFVRVMCWAKVAVISSWYRLALVLSRRNAEVCQHFLKVLLLVKVDSSSLPVSSDPHSKELRNFLEVLGVKSLMENITEPINLGLVFGGSRDVIHVDKQVKLSCLVDKKTWIC